MKKILLPIHSLEIGGAQTFMIRLANTLAKKYEVAIFDHNPHRTSAEMLANVAPNIKIFAFEPKGFKNWFIWKINAFCNFFCTLFHKNFSFYELQKFNYYRQKVKEFSPDIINSHSIFADEMYLKAGFDYPLVCSMHGEYEMRKELDKENFNPLPIFQKAKYFILASDKNKETILPFEQNHTINYKKIYYGFPKMDFIPKKRTEITTDENAIIFGIVARSMPEKGWTETIIAFENLQKNNTKNIFLVLVGDGEYLQNLKNKYQNNKNIIFAGAVNNALVWVSVFDVGILASYFKGESLPNTIIEYLYCQKAVIATQIGDVPQMIESTEGNAGIIIPLTLPNPPKIEDLEEAMKTYILDKNLLVKHQKNAKLAFEKFDMDICVKNYEEVYF